MAVCEAKFNHTVWHISRLGAAIMSSSDAGAAHCMVASKCRASGRSLRGASDCGMFNPNFHSQMLPSSQPAKILLPSSPLPTPSSRTRNDTSLLGHSTITLVLHSVGACSAQGSSTLCHFLLLSYSALFYSALTHSALLSMCTQSTIFGRPCIYRLYIDLHIEVSFPGDPSNNLEQRAVFPDHWRQLPSCEQEKSSAP